MKIGGYAADEGTHREVILSSGGDKVNSENNAVSALDPRGEGARQSGHSTFSVLLACAGSFRYVPPVLIVFMIDPVGGAKVLVSYLAVSE